MARDGSVASIVERSPGIEAGHDVERRLEGQRLAFFEDEVLDVGRLDRLDALFDERVADGLRDQVLGDVLHDLRLEALADHVGRDLAGAEAGDLRGAAELRGGVADGFVNDVLGTSIVRSRRVSFTSTISDFIVLEALPDPHRRLGYAKEGTRTPTAFRLPAPKTGASASSATLARGLTDQG